MKRINLLNRPAAEVFTIESIETMVHAFYGRVRDDDLIGPVFAARIADWTPHLDRMVLFWRAVLRSEPTFKPSERGAPPALHDQMDELQLAHFDRWLALFETTVFEIYPPDAAPLVLDCARRIGHVFSRRL